MGKKILAFGVDVSLSTSRSTAAGSEALFYGPLSQADPQTNIKELSERQPPKGFHYFFPVKWQVLTFNVRRLLLPPSSGEVTLGS